MTHLDVTKNYVNLTQRSRDRSKFFFDIREGGLLHALSIESEVELCQV